MLYAPLRTQAQSEAEIIFLRHQLNVLEPDLLNLNRKGIPKSREFWFKMLAGLEASMDGSSLFVGSS